MLTLLTDLTNQCIRDDSFRKSFSESIRKTTTKAFTWINSEQKVFFYEKKNSISNELFLVHSATILTLQNQLTETGYCYINLNNNLPDIHHFQTGKEEASISAGV
jgi:hypothetical protein